MQFDIEETNSASTPYKMTTKTNQNVKLDFFMTDGGECEEIHIDGYEYHSTNDTMDGIWVAFGQKFFTITDVRRKAEYDFPELLEENLAVQREYESYERYLSCPRMTDRI